MRDVTAEVPELRLAESFRLGGPDVSAEVSFRSEPEIAVHATGLLFVRHPDQLAVFDSTGRFVRWIGRRGDGPGEFEGIENFGFVGDTLWVRNSPTPRISTFLLDGTHLETEATPFDYGRPFNLPQGLSGYLENGRAWVEPHGIVLGEARPVQVPVLLTDRAPAHTDTLFSVPNPTGRLGGIEFVPFRQPPFFDVAEDGSGVLLAEWSDSAPTDIHVRFFGPGAATLFDWTLHVAARPVPAPVRDSLVSAGVDAIENAAESLRKQGFPEGLFRSTISRTELEEVVYLPRYHPPLSAVRIGLDHTVWIERTDVAGAGSWLALDRDGNAIFRIHLPDAATLREASRDAIWGTTRDDLDVPYLVRWNVLVDGGGRI